MARSCLAGLGVASGADPAAWWAPGCREEAVSLSVSPSQKQGPACGPGLV